MARRLERVEPTRGVCHFAEPSGGGKGAKGIIPLAPSFLLQTYGLSSLGKPIQPLRQRKRWLWTQKELV